MGFRPPGKPLHPLKTPLWRLSFHQGELLCKLSLCAPNRWMKVYPKCARWLVFIETAACVLESSLFLICAFLSTCEFSTCRALSVLDLFVPEDGQQQQHTQSRSSPAFIHWMSQSFHCFVITPCFHLCVWTLLLRRQRMTTSCLGLFISDWLYHISSPLICKDSVKPSCPDAFSSLLPCN